jgi:hypothetical protein
MSADYTFSQVKIHGMISMGEFLRLYFEFYVRNTFRFGKHLSTVEKFDVRILRQFRLDSFQNENAAII